MLLSDQPSDWKSVISVAPLPILSVWSQQLLMVLRTLKKGLDNVHGAEPQRGQPRTRQGLCGEKGPDVKD